MTVLGRSFAPSVLADLRAEYHRSICAEILGYRERNGERTGVYSNADTHSVVSVELARRVASLMAHPCCENPPVGQGAGSKFSSLTERFLRKAFRYLAHIRPGNWQFSLSQANPGIALFDQYAHLQDLDRLLESHPEIKTALGGDYLITPDIVISRSPLEDCEINAASNGNSLVQPGGIPYYTPLRKRGAARQNNLLHASISCKWTMRSDRAQNSRSEALNLIRNRKGNTPHIVVVTFEPLPARIASIALGTGDIDCTYHAALSELVQAAEEGGYDDALEMLKTLIDGRRLRDISDLPFDLAV